MMRDSKRHIATLSITLVVTALLMFANANSYANASRVWVVGSQLSEVAASGNNVYVLWQNNSPDQNVYFRKSIDNGATFDKLIMLSNADSGGHAANPMMAVSGNHVYVAWMDTTFGENTKVHFRKSADGGATFERPQVLSNNLKGSSGIQQLFASGDSVYVVMIDEWAEADSYYYDVKLGVSRDNGETFSEPVSLHPHLAQSNVRSVSSVAVHPYADGDAIYVVGVDYGDCTPEQVRCGLIAEIFFRKSEDGKVFSDPVVIERPPETLDAPEQLRVGGPNGLQVSADNTHVTIIWSDRNFSEERQAIFMARSNDRGETFSETVQLDRNGGGGSSDDPVLVSTLDSTFVAWNDRDQERSYPNVALANVNEGSPASPVDVSGRTTIPFWDVAASERNVYVAWNNRTSNVNGLPDGNDVYFASSSDGGQSFGNPARLSDDNALKTLFAAQQKPLSFVAPKLAVSGDQVYVGWQASYPDSHEIFLAASGDGGHTFGPVINLNEAAGDPVSKGFAILTSSQPIYAVAIVGAIAAGALGIIFIKRRGGIRRK